MGIIFSSFNGLEPLLRFCEFKGNLPQVKLSELFHKCTQKNRNGAINNVICNSAKNGLIPQRDFFDKDIANSENTTGYYIIKNNDFVYNPRKSNEAPYGPVSIYKDAEDGIVSPLYLCFRATAPLCAEYFEMYFKSPAWHRYVYLMGDSGARHDRVSIKDEVFFDMPVRTPSLSEQQKIADFLSLVDARIEKQRLLVESLKKYKRGVIFKLFSKNNPNNQSFSLRELLHEKNDRNSLGLRVCSVAVNKGIIDQIEHLGRCFAASDTSKYRRVTYGDVVYTKSPTGDFPYGIVKQSKIHSDVCVSPLYGVYKTLNYEVGNLIHAYFELHQLANNYIRPLTQKGAKNTINITTSHFLDDIIYFPSNDKNRKNISNFLDKLTRCISIHEEKLRQNEKLKKGLLQKMFI